MHTGIDFPVCNPADTQPFTIDFLNDLPTGELVVAATVTLTVFQGTDANPSVHIIGTVPSAITSGRFVSQILQGLIAGNIYSLNMIATTTSGYTIELYALLPCAAVYS